MSNEPDNPPAPSLRELRLVTNNEYILSEDVKAAFDKMLQEDRINEEKHRALLQEAERELGENYPALAYPLAYLGDACSGTGREAEAEQLYTRAIAIWEQCDPDNWRIAQPLNNLGILYASQQKFDEAAALFAHAYWIERQHGGESSRLCVPLDNLSFVYHMQGNDEKGYATYLQSEAIAKEHGSDSLTYRFSDYPPESMTHFTFDIKPYQVAEEMYHQALKEARQSPGRADVAGELHAISANAERQNVMSDWEDAKRAAQMPLSEQVQKISYAETLLAAKPRIVEVLKLSEEAVVEMERELSVEGEKFPRLLADIRDVSQTLEANGPQMDSTTRTEDAGQEKAQEAATLVSLKPRLLRVLDGTESVIRRMNKEYGYDNWPVRQDIQEVVDVIAPERKQELEQLIQEHIERGKEPERLKAVNAELYGALMEANRALTQLDPLAEKHDAKIIDDALARAKSWQRPAPQPSTPEPERDRDIEPEM